MHCCDRPVAGFGDSRSFGRGNPLGDRILGLFGPSYAAAKWGLVILIAAQLIRALAGPAPMLLTLGGWQRTNAAITLACCAVLLAGNGAYPRSGIARRVRLGRAGRDRMDGAQRSDARMAHEDGSCSCFVMFRRRNTRGEDSFALWQSVAVLYPSRA